MPVGPYNPATLQGPGPDYSAHQMGESQWPLPSTPKKYSGFGQSPMKARMGSWKRGFTKQGWFCRSAWGDCDITGYSAAQILALTQALNSYFTGYWTGAELPWGFGTYGTWDTGTSEYAVVDGPLQIWSKLYSYFFIVGGYFFFQASQVYGTTGPYIVVQGQHEGTGGGLWDVDNPSNQSLVTDRKWNQYQAHYLEIPELSIDPSGVPGSGRAWSNFYMFQMTWAQYQAAYMS